MASSFNDWLNKNQVKCDHVEIFDFPDTGRGMRATRDIKAEEELFTIPETLFLTTSNPRFKSLLDSLPSELSNDDRLICIILNELHLGNKSFFSSYMPLLPREYTQSIFFNEEQLNELKGSNLFLVTSKLKEQLNEDLEALKKRLASSKNPQAKSLLSFCTKERFLWATGTIWSRCFDLNIIETNNNNNNNETQESKNKSTTTPNEQNRQRILPPFADMFNHDPNSTNYHTYDKEKKALVCIAKSAISKGEQVNFNYGRLSNFDLLRLYGFSLNDQTQQKQVDHIQLYTPMNPQAPLYSIKQTILTQQHVKENEPHFLVFDVETASTDMNRLLATLRIQRVELNELLDAADAFKKPISKRNETVVLNSLVSALESMLAEYPSTLEQDIKSFISHNIALKSKNPNSEEFNDILKRRFAVILRLSEKKILLANISHFNKLLQKL